MKNLNVSKNLPIKFIGLATVLLLFMDMQHALAQASTYQVDISNTTYTEITGGTTIWAAGATYDDNISTLQTINSFTFNGIAVTKMSISTNGWIAIGGTAASTSATVYTALSSAVTATAANGVIAPFGRDQQSATLAAQGFNSEVRWEYLSASNETVIQWKNVRTFGNTTAINYQCRLNHTTNTIQFVYGSMAIGTNATSPQVGIKSAIAAGTLTTTTAGSMISLTLANVPAGTTCSWADAVRGRVNNATMLFSNPAITCPSGTTFTFTPQNGASTTWVNPVTTVAAATGVTTGGASISWTAPITATGTAATGFNIQYRAVGTCAWTNFSGNPVATTSATLTGLSSSTSYQVRIQSQVTASGNKAAYSHPVAGITANTDGYTSTGYFTTLSDPLALNVTLTPSSTSCNGLSDGSITTAVTGGVAPYSYSWSNGATTANLSGVAAGSYSVSVTDSNGATANSTTTINEGGITALSITTVNPTCGQSNGSITITGATGGTGPYTYSLDDVTYSSTLVYINLAANSYSVYVHDDNGCEFMATESLTDQPGPTAIATTTVNPTCGQSNGSIIITGVVGGTVPYTYSLDAVTYSSNLGYNNLAAGSYIAYVRDGNGCEFLTAVPLVGQPGPTSIATTTVNPTCGQSNGSITITGTTSGTGPYTYSFNGGAFSSTTTYSALSAGSYSITVRDINGCEYSTSITLTSFSFSSITSSFLGISSNSATFQVQSTPVGTGYQWQTLSGSNWVNISNNSTYSGATTATLHAALGGSVTNNQQFRCVVSTNTCSGTSNASTLVLTPSITSLTPAQLCPAGGQTVTITGQNFSNVTGVFFGDAPAVSYAVVNNTTITAIYPPQSAAQNVAVNTLSGNATSPYIIAQVQITPNNTNLSSGVVSYSATTNTTSNNFQWQSNIGFGWQNLSDAGQYSGATTSALTIANLSIQNNNQLIRCVNTTNGCAVNSATATISTGATSGGGISGATLPGISYQAVARNSAGDAMVNQSATIKFTLHEGTATGTIAYIEQHQTTTNAFGLFALTFGNGTPLQGTFNAIHWSGTSKYLQVSVNYGSGFVDIGTQQMVSVPFAKLAEKAISIDVQSLPAFETNSQAIAGGLSAGQLYRNSIGDVRVVY